MADTAHQTDLLHDPNLWLAFSFIIFAAVVYKMGKKAIVNALDNRIANIKNEIETAKNLRDEAQKLLREYQEKQQAAQLESERIIEEAKKNAYTIKKAAEKELKETIKRKEKQLQERLTRIQQEAMNEIQAYAADLAIKTTREIISENMDAKSNQKLVDDAIAGISRAA